MITQGAVTLWHIFVGENRMPAYRRTVFPAASVQADVKTEVTEGGLKTADVIKIRIPTTESIEIKNGDRVFLGVSEEARPPQDGCYTVMGFADNRKGSPRMHHWKVVCG